MFRNSATPTGGSSRTRPFLFFLAVAVTTIHAAAPAVKPTVGAARAIPVVRGTGAGGELKGVTAHLPPLGASLQEPPSARFPEEAARIEWDKGCADWPSDLDHLRLEISKGNGDLRVITRLIFRPERGETLDELLASVERHLANERAYPAWVTPGINEKSDGGRYFVSVKELVPSFDPTARHRILRGDYNFKLLWFERDGVTSLLFRDDRSRLPECPAFADVPPERREARRFFYRMIPRPDLLQRLIGELWVYKTSTQVEARLRLVARPSRLVYELMPEALAKAELQERGRRIFENFVDFRRLDAVSKASKLAPAGSSPAAKLR